LSLPVSSWDGDLLDGDLVEPGFDEGPDGGEEVGGVDLWNADGMGAWVVVVRGREGEGRERREGEVSFGIEKGVGE